MSLAAFPVHDWQFWLATAAFLFAALWLLRGVLPLPGLRGRTNTRRSRRSVKITVDGRPVEKPRPR